MILYEKVPYRGQRTRLPKYNLCINIRQMEDIIKQQLEYYSNSQFSLPNYRKLNIPRYGNNVSFFEISNWQNSDRYASTRLPRITSQMQSKKMNEIMGRSNSFSSQHTCPIKQMDINLQPLSLNEGSYYCQYLKNKTKRPLKQIQFISEVDKQRKRSTIKRGDILSSGKLKQIIKRKKDNRFNANIQQYLRTTQLIKHLAIKKKQQ